MNLLVICVLSKPRQRQYFGRRFVIGGFKGLKFRRQVPIDKYTVDFLCVSEKLIIEIDDPSHADKKDYDALRTEVLENYGYRVMRFWNEEIYNNLEDVLRHVSACVGDS